MEKHPYRYFQTFIRSLRTFVALGRLARRPWSLQQAHSNPLKKKSLGFVRLLCVLPLEHGWPASSILGLPDALGIDFGGPHASIFELFRRSCTVGGNFVRKHKNTMKISMRSTSELPRDNTKTTSNRSAVVCDTACCSKLAWTLLRGGPGAAGDRTRNPFG